MACFIASGAAARAQMLTALTEVEAEREFLQSIGATNLTATRFTITNEQFKQYMQWKQERCIAMKKAEAKK